MGTLLHHCVEVRTAIELSFGVVTGVGQAFMCSLASREGAISGMVSGIFWHFGPIHFSGQHDVRNVFDSCMKS